MREFVVVVTPVRAIRERSEPRIVVILNASMHNVAYIYTPAKKSVAPQSLIYVICTPLVTV